MKQMNSVVILVLHHIVKATEDLIRRTEIRLK